MLNESSLSRLFPEPWCAATISREVRGTLHRARPGRPHRDGGQVRDTEPQRNEPSASRAMTHDDESKTANDKHDNGEVHQHHRIGE